MKRRWSILTGLAGALLLLAALRPAQILTPDAGDGKAASEDETIADATSGVPSSDERKFDNDWLMGWSAENASTHLAQLAEIDIAGVAALVERLPVGDRQRDLARAVLVKLVEKNPVLAGDWVAHLAEPLGSQMAAALAPLWFELDNRGAIEWVKNLPIGNLRSQALVSLSADWAAVNPQGAAEFAINSSNADFRVSDGNSSDDQRGEETGSLLRSQILDIIGARWAANDSDAAVAWAIGLAPGHARDSFIAGLSSVLAETSPAEAATLVSSMTPGSLQENAALNVLLEWGRSDLPAAAQWLTQFPTGDSREKALLNLASISAEQGPEYAKAFLLNWPEPNERTSAIRHHLTEILGTDASRGPDLLEGIDDHSLFLEEIERVAEHWLAQDYVAASRWIAGLDLPDPTKVKLLTASGWPAPFH